MQKLSRNSHLFRSAFTLLALCLAPNFALIGQQNQTPLAGSSIPQFVQPLPILSVSPFSNLPAPNPPYLKAIDTIFGNGALSIHMCEFDASVLPPGTPLAAGATGTTRVWGYIPETAAVPWTGCPAATQETYIGPVIVNTRSTTASAQPPSTITWINDLGDTATTGVLAYKFSTDQTLHWADPLNNEANACAMTGGLPAFGSACAQNYAGPVPGVVHLHGGEVPPEIDGGPDAWFTSDGVHKGHGYYSFAGAPDNAAIYKYPNTQEAAPIWFHDHVLGATRLNVFAGLAGAYFIQDPALHLPANLQSLPEVVPLVIQDRTFDTNGQLFLPADSAGGILWTPNPEHPYWVPEFVGTTIVVNGKVWPFLTVEARRYRFLFLNGSNARTYEMSLINQATGAPGPAMWIIGTDGGYLDAPVKIDPALGQKLIMMPGERYEVIIDFGGFPNANLIIKNTGRTPYPKGAPPQGSTLGRIIQFRVGVAPAVDSSFDPAVAGATIRQATPVDQRIKRLPGTPGGPAIVTAAGPTQNVQKTRELTLNEVLAAASTVIDPVTGVLTAYPGGPLEILVNNTKWVGSNRPDFTPITVGASTTFYSELPREGDTEIWEIINLTADSHPIHLHLVQFQLMNRQNFNVNKYNQAYAAAFGAGPVPLPAGCTAGLYCPGYGPPLNYNPSTASGGKFGGNPDITRWLQGAALPPAANETGWKDTIIVPPGMVTRIAVRWAPTDLPVQTTPNLNTLFFPFDPGSDLQHGYVWHCHIIDHEDNEMMRPDLVQLNPAATSTRPLVRGIDY
ncbi:MAG: multicopper oxidase domain-containing protein [Actinomycetota bacterium]